MYGAKANDLWNAIALVSKDLAWPERLNSWSNQEGYPLITVDNPLALSQVRFFNNYVEDSVDEDPVVGAHFVLRLFEDWKGYRAI